MSQDQLILQLAVPTPLRGSFDYLPPAGTEQSLLTPGIRVRVPFGRTKAVGVLLEVSHTSRIDRQRLKPALELLDAQPVLPPDLQVLARWASNYYHHPIGEVMAAILPALLRRGLPACLQPAHRWQLTQAGCSIKPDMLKRAPRQAQLMQHLQQHPQGIDAAQLNMLDADWRPVMRTLMNKGWVISLSSAPVAEMAATPQARPGLHLNAAQAAAVDTITGALNHFQPYLLDGITGSGKTEVYLQVISQVLAQGRQVLILVPEIGLTPQLVARFSERHAVPLAILHSGLSDRERLDAWLKARDGRAAVVIGTRSAVFTPMPKLGLIIIDEEHDLSFKQQDGFRYHARDVAVMRARQSDIPVVLGSATPSLESLCNVQRGRYVSLPLPERAGKAQRPVIKTLDVRRQPMHGPLSRSLLEHMKIRLEQGEQVLLFLNRRGYAPVWMCHACGWSARCARCDANLTYHHGQRRLRCHHCAADQPVATQCPACSAGELITVGHGTERIEQILREQFPAYHISRIDRDTTRRKGALQDMLHDAQSGASNILIGTQMLTKGHHLPRVTLVAVLDADQGLFGVDFRASERLAQLIIQVAGRAGREDKAGLVLIQTHNPDHPLLRTLLDRDYHAFADAALQERRTAVLPPYTNIALLRSEATKKELPQRFLEQALACARELDHSEVELYGPVAAPMERRAGRYRAQILIQSSHRNALHPFLERWLTALVQLPAARKVRWSLDVDPMDLM